jgi:aspartyl-tRNA(Asn)/glutamyl-tRNA(Gln) amidotransferase subunit A
MSGFSVTSVQNTVKSVKEGLEKGEFSVEEIRREYLKRIEKENPKLNAYLSIFNSQKLETENCKLKTGPLAGIPCAIKDNILIASEKCTAGSKILENYVASYDATVAARLKKAGAVFLGKTNLDEFAMGSTGENSAFGPTLNPHDCTRVAGGSSSGSGAAVAADLAVFALGSDTGGSIRAPASFCGVVGVKPTYGVISRYGLIAMASSFDQIGPITKTVEDAAIVLNAIAGRDPLDSTSVPRDLPDYTTDLGKPIKGLKIGVPKEFMGEGLDPEINTLVQKALSELESLGAHIDEVSLPLTDYALAAYYIIVPSEISANLARYDGIKYGLSVQEGKNLLDVYLKSRAEGFGGEVKRRTMLGTYVLSAGYYEAYYLKAQKVRALIKRDFEKVFEKFDIIVGPTMPIIAPKLGELSDPLSAYTADIYTVQVNIAGLPAISVPCGFVETDGSRLPAGLQIIGKHFDESRILQIAYAYEESSKSK